MIAAALIGLLLALVGYAYWHIARWSRRCPDCGSVSRSTGAKTNTYLCVPCNRQWRVESDEEEYLAASSLPSTAEVAEPEGERAIDPAVPTR